MRQNSEHALSVLKSNSFGLKWKRVVSVLSPLSLFSRGGSHIWRDFQFVFSPRPYRNPTAYFEFKWYKRRYLDLSVLNSYLLCYALYIRRLMKRIEYLS